MLLIGWSVVMRVIGFGGGNNDGGFLSSQDQFASPAGQSKARRGVTVVPLTLRAVKKLPEDNPEMFGIQVCT
ncbi:hypothetical protein Hamer_G005000, partial [Homarus americanus]